MPLKPRKTVLASGTDRFSNPYPNKFEIFHTVCYHLLSQLSQCKHPFRRIYMPRLDHLFQTINLWKHLRHFGCHMLFDEEIYYYKLLYIIYYHKLRAEDHVEIQVMLCPCPLRSLISRLWVGHVNTLSERISGLHLVHRVICLNTNHTNGVVW